MIDGYTLTRERLTYDDREPDAYDWMANEVDPDERYVVRRYDRIVRVYRILITEEELRRTLALQFNIVITTEASWGDYVLLADELHARYVCAQPESLPIVSTAVLTEV